ncbi:hypothetical protein CNECB9_1350012 [Cupriavidus necator]|uniref:Uncharacterized protein n=1 Tax=Cupriavidus necator TaxID=106590 RepID=A0A1K0I9C6_CUPNE|nr:hypothetical protein CNECB9_1350012 [Cupriavidus necator]
MAANMDKDSAHAAVTAAEQKKEHDISRRVTYAVNGGYIDEERRWQYTRAAKDILS